MTGNSGKEEAKSGASGPGRGGMRRWAPGDEEGAYVRTEGSRRKRKRRVERRVKEMTRRRVDWLKEKLLCVSMTPTNPKPPPPPESHSHHTATIGQRTGEIDGESKTTTTGVEEGKL